MVGELVEMLIARDTHGALTWLDALFPKCMRLIPPGRREKFLKGVYQCHEDGRL